MEGPVSPEALGEVGSGGTVMLVMGGLERGWGSPDAVGGSDLILLERDLPDLPVAHEGTRHLVHPLACPHPDDEIGGEIPDFLTDLPLEGGSGGV